MATYKAEISENIVIGALMNDINLILEMTHLKVEYFTSKVNKMLFTVIKRLFKAGSESIDIADVYALVESDKKTLKLLNDNGGMELLEILHTMGEDKSIDDVKVHVENIRKSAFKNELSDTLTSLQGNIAASGSKSIGGIYNDIEKEILSLKGKYSSTNHMELIGNRMDSIMAELDREANKTFSGFPTGFPLLDKYVTYEKGEMVVISAPAKFGKSQYVVDLVYRLCICQKVPIAVIDSELSDRFFTVRLIARITNLPFKYIKNGQYKDEDWAYKKVQDAIKLIKEAPLMHEYFVGWTKEEIKLELKRMKIQHNLQIVVWDYLKINNIEENQQERIELAMLTNFLKNEIGGDLNVAVVALAQTSDYSKSEGGLRIFGSNQIKQYCSTVIYMVRKTKDQVANDYGDLGGSMYMFIKENRNGQQMTDESIGINFTFDTSRAKFEQAQYQHEEIIQLVQDELSDTD